MTRRDNGNDVSEMTSPPKESAVTDEEPHRHKIMRRVPRKVAADVSSPEGSGGDTAPARGRPLFIDTSKVKPFRGFDHTPEEARRLVRTSFTDAPLLRKIKR